MQVIHPVCCGIDCHQAQLTACLRKVSEDGQITTELRDFGTTYRVNCYLRQGLVQCAWGTRKTGTFLGRTFRRLEVRIGKKKAALALAHKILVIIYHRLSDGTFYDEERDVQVGPRQEERDRKRAIKALERLGYSVTVERVA